MVTEADYVVFVAELADRMHLNAVHFEFAQLPVLQLFARFAPTSGRSATLAQAIASHASPEVQLLSVLADEAQVATVAPFLNTLHRNGVRMLGDAFLASMTEILAYVSVWRKQHPRRLVPRLVIVWDGDNVHPTAGTRTTANRPWFNLQIHGRKSERGHWNHAHRSAGTPVGQFNQAGAGSESADHDALFHLACNWAALGHLVLLVSGGWIHPGDGVPVLERAESASVAAGVAQACGARVAPGAAGAATTTSRQWKWIRCVETRTEAKVMLGWFTLEATGNKLATQEQYAKEERDCKDAKARGRREGERGFGTYRTGYWGFGR